MAGWAEEMAAWCEEKHFTAATRERWRRLPPPDGEALWRLVRELRLGENQLRDLWEWAEEVAARDSLPLRAVLDDAFIREALQRRLSRNDRLKLVRQALRRRRFPHLAAVEDELHALVREARLPAEVHLQLPPDLEGDAIQVRIVARSSEQFVQTLQSLAEWARSDACQRVFALLEEAP